MKLQLHPDGVVYLRDASDVLYSEARALFEAEIGSIELPAGMVALEYDEGVLTWFDAKGNAFPVEGRASFAVGDEAMADLAGLLQRQAARNAPLPPKPPGPDEELAAKKNAAIKSLEEQRLALAMSDQSAPQAVKDYAAAIEAAK